MAVQYITILGMGLTQGGNAVTGIEPVGRSEVEGG